MLSSCLLLCRTTYKWKRKGALTSMLTTTRIVTHLTFRAVLGTARTEVTEYEGNLVKLPAKLDDESSEKAVANLSLSDTPETLAPILSFSRRLNKFGVTLNAHHGLEVREFSNTTITTSSLCLTLLCLINCFFFRRYNTGAVILTL